MTIKGQRTDYRLHMTDKRGIRALTFLLRNTTGNTHSYRVSKCYPPHSRNACLVEQVDLGAQLEVEKTEWVHAAGASVSTVCVSV